MKKSEGNVDMSRLPAMHCCSPVINVCRYLFTELNDDLTKRTVLSIVISWTKSIVHVTHSLFLSSISAIFFVSACQKFKRKRRNKDAPITAFTSLSSLHSRLTTTTVKIISLFLYYVVFFLCRLKGEETAVSFYRAELSRKKFSLQMTENRGLFLQCNCDLWKTFRGIERMWNVFKM
jgi:hypothetical protein